LGQEPVNIFVSPVVARKLNDNLFLIPPLFSFGKLHFYSCLYFSGSSISSPISKISEGRRTVKINEVLPFRVRFTNIMIPGYGPNNPAPIGIAVIGLNNYIL
jgi:hypothetical protein